MTGVVQERRMLGFCTVSYVDMHGVPTEWLGYLNHVSDWERERYLKFF